MLTHLFNMLGRAFASIPPTLGSNWFGLIFTVIIILFGEAIGLYFFGWQAMIQNWKKATGIGFAALGVGYTLVFAWCVVTTTFNDHVALAGRVQQLNSTVFQDKAHEATSVQDVRIGLGSQISELREKCAKTEGANDVLSKQNIDQQGTINNCQTQAIKMMTPQPLKWKALAVDTNHSAKSTTARWLLIADREVGAADIIFHCDPPISQADAVVVSSPTQEMTTRLNSVLWETKVSAPGWGFETPILITTTSDYPVQPPNMNCSFHLGSQ